MRVSRLRLENFRIHTDSTLDLDDRRFVVVRGRNFAGKSSIGQGLSMCLTPSTTGLDAQGRGYISKIKRGASKAVITANLQTKHHLVQRTVTLNTNASGRTPKTICLSDPSWNVTRFDAELEKQRVALTVALNTDAFLHMDEKEQKNLLAGLALPRRYDFPQETVAQVEAILGQGSIHFADEPFMVINQAYKRLFDERQIVNRQVKEFVVPEMLTVPEGIDSSSLQQKLTALREERRERQQKRDQAVAEATKQEYVRNQAKAKVQQAIDGDTRRKNSIRATLLKDGQLGYLRTVAAGKEEWDRLEIERREIVTTRDHLDIQLEGLEAIPWGTTTCPTCDQPVDSEKLKSHAGKIAGWLGDVANSLGVIEQKQKALGDVSEAIALVEAHEKAQRELDEFDAQASGRQEIEEAQKGVPEAILFSFAPYNESLAECDTEIERLSGLLRPVIVAEERRKEIEVRRSQLAILKDRATVLDQLVKYFDKDGIKAKLIGQYIGGFEQKLNEVMGAWGYSCALSIEPYSFDVTNARGDVVPLRELSGAERIMFSLAFQCAVSRTAGIGIVVIDEMAMLLPEIRPAMNERLYRMIEDDHLDQVIMLVADSSERIPSLPGVAFYMVDEGTVYPLHQNSFIRKETADERRNDQRNIA